MQRFFLNTSLLWDTQLIIDDNEIYYQITKVLRAKIKDSFIFFDGERDIDFLYEITSIDKKNIIFSLSKTINKNKKINYISLYQSMPNKLDKIELILQKWVEVWYDEFYFFRSKRSQDLKISENKFERLNKIVIEASEQSGKNKIPKIIFLEKLDFKNILWDNFYFHTDEKWAKKLLDLKNVNSKINIFVWPEGWFDESETLEFDKNNFSKIYLWNSILRTETASIVVWFYFNQNF